MLTGGEWTKGFVSHLVVNRLIWFTEGGWGQSMGSPCLGGWASLSKQAQQFSRPRHALSWPVCMKFKWILDERNTLVFALIAKHVKALKASKTTSLLVRHCQRALNEIFTHHSVGLIWVPRHSGIRGNEIADELAGEGSVHQVAEPEPALEVSRQNTGQKIKCWLTNQHIALWQGLTSTQTQTEQLVHNILRRHLYMMWLIDSPLRRWCRAEEETAYILCKCEAVST